MNRLYGFLAVAVLLFTAITFTNCANIVPPAGGAKDTIPPRLVYVNPEDSTLNFKSRKITFVFNEYVELDNVIEKLIVSPTLQRTPTITAKLRTVTVQIKDTLKPNTTYTFNFDDAVKDVNERNPVQDFQYVFSTGDYLDSLQIHGKLTMAETGTVDSNVAVMLYTSMADSVVAKEKPQYFAKTKRDGSFHFKNLAPGRYKIFALKEEDKDLQYTNPAELIAYRDLPITLQDANVENINLLMFKALDTTKPFVPIPEEPDEETEKKEREKRKKIKLVAAPQLNNNQQDLNDSLRITFNVPIRTISTIDSSRIKLQEDTLFTPVNFNYVMDSLNTKMSIIYNWKEGKPYRLILPAGFATDTLGNITKTDTVSFSAKEKADYSEFIGTLKKSEETQKMLAADTSLRLIMQLVNNKVVKYAGDVTNGTWKQSLIIPGEYEIRILIDENHNGIWDTGSYFIEPKRQPERVIAFPKTVNMKANWLMPETLEF
ncbi:Ig-like domain-containing protein [Chitinophaga skermanii]|uniref:Ig-like domain-containing protein n=1 Tax=Chitinophaga skermanii TaxID=331697 RepID=A0A327Q6J7_9BACT|nr:Ig-like domain-containing protein [Chitinophaga skermanii]RAI97476.1 Ig-like domain-containing protein [Chitinophaga skermanii]